MKSIQALMAVVGVVLVQAGTQSHAEQKQAPWSAGRNGAPSATIVPISYQNYVSDEPQAALAGHVTADEPALAPVEAAPAVGRGCTSCAPGPGADCTSGSCASRSCGDACGGYVPCGGLLWEPWVTFEYMHVWTEPRYLPPLVTTSPPGTPSSICGRLPAATILYGDEEIGGDLQPSARLSFGAFLDPGTRFGVGAKLFASGGETESFSAASNAAGLPMLARPFYNTDPAVNAQDALLISRDVPVLTGSVYAESSNDVLSAEVYGRYLLYCSQGRRLDFIAGYQFGRIDDSLMIANESVSAATGLHYNFRDLFDARNYYNGGEVGLLGQYDAGPLTFSLLGKLGIGNMHQEVTISGNSSVALAGQANPPLLTGGLLAMPTNIGVHEDDTFALLPEAEIKIGYRLTRRLELSLGYALTCWSKVALAADQIDVSQANTPTVNASQLLGGPLAGPANPVLPEIRDNTFWLQGITIGLTLRM